MEIRDQCVDSAECSRRIDEEIGFGVAGLTVAKWCAVTGEEIFDRSHTGRAYGDAPAAVASEERMLSGGGHFISLAVDGVCFDGVGGDRLERSKADVQRDVGGFDALLAQRFE